MKTHPPEVFETTLQKTNLWLKQICDCLHWDDHHKAYHGLRAVCMPYAIVCLCRKRRISALSSRCLSAGSTTTAGNQHTRR